MVGRGYAALSVNWGGNGDGKPPFNSPEGAQPGDPNTDWGALDATHPPQRNQANHFAGGTEPDAFTLDAVDSPRNDNWFLVTLAARRAGVPYVTLVPSADRLEGMAETLAGSVPRLSEWLTGALDRLQSEHGLEPRRDLETAALIAMLSSPIGRAHV